MNVLLGGLKLQRNCEVINPEFLPALAISKILQGIWAGKPKVFSWKTRLLDLFRDPTKNVKYSGQIESQKGTAFEDSCDWVCRDFWKEMGTSKNRGIPKWMVKILENPIKMDDLVGFTPIFGSTPRWNQSLGGCWIVSCRPSEKAGSMLPCGMPTRGRRLCRVWGGARRGRETA